MKWNVLVYISFGGNQCVITMFFKLEYEMIVIITTNVENSFVAQINYYVNRISKSEQPFMNSMNMLMEQLLLIIGSFSGWNLEEIGGN